MKLVRTGGTWRRSKYAVPCQHKMVQQWSLAQIGAIQTVITLFTVLHAVYQKRQFFPTCVYLLQSGPSFLVMVAYGVFLMILLANIIRMVVFGELRPVEKEHLHEYGWMALSESFLAMTIFRSDFDSSIAFIFTGLLVCKAFHWIARDRVDYMEQAIRLPDKFHVRMMTAVYILAGTDIVGAYLAIHSVIKRGPSLCILLANEFLLMFISSMSILSRYLLNLNDIRLGSPWENKSAFLFYLDFVLDLSKLLVYSVFFSAIIAYYGIPIHIIRDLYLTFRSFVLRVNDILKYRQATLDMDRRYQTVGAEELAQAIDRVCIICREEMEATANGPKRLGCGHIFHVRCLKSWLERQQACPTCRKPVLDSNTPTPQPRRRNGQPAEAAANAGPIYPGHMRPTPSATPTDRTTSPASTPRLFYVSPDDIVPTTDGGLMLRSSSGENENGEPRAQIYLERMSPPTRFRAAEETIDNADDLLIQRGSSLEALRSQIESLDQVKDEIERLLAKAKRIESAVMAENLQDENDSKGKGQL